jgi:hypothetical protein
MNDDLNQNETDQSNQSNGILTYVACTLGLIAGVFGAYNWLVKPMIDPSSQQASQAIQAPAPTQAVSQPPNVLASPIVTPTMVATPTSTPAAVVPVKAVNTVSIQQPPAPQTQPSSNPGYESYKDATAKALEAALQLQVKTKEIENSAKPKDQQKAGPGF